MKKITFLFALAVMSCSKPDEVVAPAPAPVVINCWKFTQVRTQIQNTGYDSGWVDNGAKVFYSNLASDCNKIIPGSAQQVGYQTTTIRYQCRCL
jgi:hypothetical protein